MSSKPMDQPHRVCDGWPVCDIGHTDYLPGVCVELHSWDVDI